MTRILALLFALLPGIALAQSTATRVTPGYLATSGCPGGTAPCFVLYGPALPVAPFAPNGNTSGPLAVTTTTASAALPTGTTVVVTNTGAAAAYVALGASSASATTSAGLWIPAGGSAGFAVGSNAYLAAITASGSTSLALAGGSGLWTNTGGGGGGVVVTNWPSSQAVTGTFWQATQPVSLTTLPALAAGSAAIGTVGVTALPALVAGSATIGSTTMAPTNNASTLTLPSTTTAYGANTLIASSATAGSVTVPTITLANGAGAIPALRISTNDTVSTSWGGQTVQVDLWTTAPTFTNGDRGAWAVATGAAYHLRSFTCTLSAVGGDGSYGECSPAVASFALPKLASGTTLYWTLEAITGSGVTGASKVWTLTAETLQ